MSPDIRTRRRVDRARRSRRDHTSTRPGGASAAPRIIWLDSARGAAVVAVVLLHVSIGHFYMLDHSSRYTVPVWDRVNQVISVVRMPLLFVVSGMLAAGKIRRGFAHGKSLLTVATNYYLYLVWLLVYGALMLIAGDRPVPFRFWSFQHYAMQVVVPETHLWFVFSLAVYVLVLTALRRVPGAIVIAAATLLHLWAATTFTIESPLWTRGLQYAVFFVIGVHARGALLWVARQHWLTILTCGAAVWLYLQVTLRTIMSLEVADLRSASLLGLLYLVATLAAVGLAGLLARVPLYRAMGSWVGRRTLGIYVMHIPVIVVVNFALDGPLMWLSPVTANSFVFDISWPLVLTAIVVAVCVGVETLLTGCGLRFLFRIPAPLAARLERPVRPAPAAEGGREEAVSSGAASSEPPEPRA